MCIYLIPKEEFLVGKGIRPVIIIPCCYSRPTLLTFVALPLVIGVPASSARQSRASFISHLLAPQPCRAGPSPWMAFGSGMWFCVHCAGTALKSGSTPFQGKHLFCEIFSPPLCPKRPLFCP